MELKINILDAGYCIHPECITLKGGRFTNKIFPAMFMHIEHPIRGHILYDTGYSSHIERETRFFPNKIYTMVTPIFAEEKDFAVNKLKELGVEKEDVKYIIISHFHADHIGGVSDFPNAKYIYIKSDYEKVKNLKGLHALLNAFLPGLLPKDFLERSIPIDNHYKTSSFHSRIESVFEHTYDLFGDGSLIAVDLPGHTSAQMGLYLKTQDGEYFLVADSCWMSTSIRNNVKPSLISNLIHTNSKKLYQTIGRLHRLYKEAPEIEQIPSHCGEMFRKHVTNCKWDAQSLNRV